MSASRLLKAAPSADVRSGSHSAAAEFAADAPCADDLSADFSDSATALRETQVSEAGREHALFKRACDIALGAALLFFFAPLMGVIFLLVRLDGGPAIFVQQRVGKGGFLFPCFKFRSMTLNAEKTLERLLVCNEQFRKEWDADRKLRNDPRITRLGAFLRRKSLDELPQLFNVLRGEMSLVGPRPISPDEIDKYGPDIKYYLATRPGLTGAWQVSGRNDVPYEKRVALDVDYALNGTWRDDFAILFKTIGVVIIGRGAL
ncbi:MAG: sugar transferase [Pseudomonadota bacterium]